MDIAVDGLLILTVSFAVSTLAMKFLVSLHRQKNPLHMQPEAKFWYIQAMKNDKK